ncbi:neuronal acetylcholine receptor subunit alpha-3-like [Lytechinus pictus]|uniref:neuronal acetylcholine receptor subunit alpha-3-like n=1 Tax=Lytechinus pictus TaxID=7653 RepID=UPI0030BA13DD
MKVLLGLYLLCFICMFGETIANPVEKRLKDTLFTGYDKSLLPSHEESLDLSLQMSLACLKEVDFSQGIIKMNVWLKMLWQDSRLEWDPEQFGNTSILRVHSSEVFKPDISLYNSHSPNEMLSDDIAVLVYNTGTVFYLPPMAIEASCAFDFKDYPYDTHKCRLKLGSWSYDNSKIMVTSSANVIDMADYWGHPVWDIVETSAVKNTISYPCCEDVYEDVTFHLTIRRRDSHGYIASSVIATWLILVVFLIGPSSAGERTLFAGLVFVSLVVLSAALSGEVPIYSATRLGRFLIAGMLVTAIVMVINGLICRFYPKDQPGQMKEGDGTAPRVFLFIDIGAFLGSVIILAILTGALFA